MGSGFRLPVRMMGGWRWSCGYHFKETDADHALPLPTDRGRCDRSAALPHCPSSSISPSTGQTRIYRRTRKGEEKPHERETRQRQNEKEHRANTRISHFKDVDERSAVLHLIQLASLRRKKKNNLQLRIIKLQLVRIQTVRPLRLVQTPPEERRDESLLNPRRLF